MKGLRRVDPIQIRNFDDILTRCGEIGEFRGIVEEIKSVIYGKKWERMDKGEHKNTARSYVW